MGTQKSACPAGSKIGTVAIETDLPTKSLTGTSTLAAQRHGPITDPPFPISIDAESAVRRLGPTEGTATPNPSTGRLK